MAAVFDLALNVALLPVPSKGVRAGEGRSGESPRVGRFDQGHLSCDNIRVGRGRVRTECGENLWADRGMWRIRRRLVDMATWISAHDSQTVPAHNAPLVFLSDEHTASARRITCGLRAPASSCFLACCLRCTHALPFRNISSTLSSIMGTNFPVTLPGDCGVLSVWRSARLPSTCRSHLGGDGRESLLFCRVSAAQSEEKRDRWSDASVSTLVPLSVC